MLEQLVLLRRQKVEMGQILRVELLGLHSWVLVQSSRTLLH